MFTWDCLFSIDCFGQKNLPHGRGRQVITVSKKVVTHEQNQSIDPFLNVLECDLNQSNGEVNQIVHEIIATIQQKLKK